jgi:hypothetical protein
MSTFFNSLFLSLLRPSFHFGLHLYFVCFPRILLHVFVCVLYLALLCIVICTLLERTSGLVYRCFADTWLSVDGYCLPLRSAVESGGIGVTSSGMNENQPHSTISHTCFFVSIPS